MHRTRPFRTIRCRAGILAALAATLLATTATTAPAAFALPVPPMGHGDATPPPAVQTVQGGGMPGWQIALIAVAATASGERAAHAAVRYPRAFIEWKLSAGPPQQYA
jgi:hypothetical protein